MNWANYTEAARKNLRRGRQFMSLGVAVAPEVSGVRADKTPRLQKLDAWALN